MRAKYLITVITVFITGCSFTSTGFTEEMDSMWGDTAATLQPYEAFNAQLFADGNYAMFIHWGLYSQLGNKVNGKTYYGISEWIMHKNMANIPIDEYKAIAKEFNPVNFDAMAIARLAKDAGMKYIVVGSKHHDGFAMYHSKANAFNIVDATPFDRDPMKELSDACQELGLGLGFYYSHNQDWTFPGGGRGPETDDQGNIATFDDYFQKKCLPQVKEITSQYGPIVLVWFDTPGNIPKKYVEQLIEVVRENQPQALVSGRVGHGLGDFQSLGDMEIPHRNIEGLWETVDTTNDSWGYAWYDENWKTPETIVKNLIACVARGGTYMLNIGPRGDGSVPKRAAHSLIKAGEWIKRYPKVVYGTQASPWKHALPWGDVTVRDNHIYLCIFQWPSGGHLYLPGLKTEIRKAELLANTEKTVLEYEFVDGWVKFKIPCKQPDDYVSVIDLELSGTPEVDDCWAIDPVVETGILAEFAAVTGAKAENKRWMEKYGEWKHVVRVTGWHPGDKATWEIDVLQPGDYQVDLTYAGKERLVWQVAVEGGDIIRNQQDSSHRYQRFPIGWLNFPKAGRYQLSVSCLEGNMADASLKEIHFVPIKLRSALEEM